MNFEKIYEKTVTLVDGSKLDLSDEDEAFLDSLSALKDAYRKAVDLDVYEVLPTSWGEELEEAVERFYVYRKE